MLRDAELIYLTGVTVRLTVCVCMYLCVTLIVVSLAAELLRNILTQQTAKQMLKVYDGIPILLR